MVGAQEGDFVQIDFLVIPPKFKHINCGYNSNFAIDQNNSYYVWGENNNYKLTKLKSNNDKELFCFTAPIKLELDNSLKLKELFFGSNFSVGLEN